LEAVPTWASIVTPQQDGRTFIISAVCYSSDYTSFALLAWNKQVGKITEVARKQQSHCNLVKL
jgi:hypothetical protein